MNAGLNSQLTFILVVAFIFAVGLVFAALHDGFDHLRAKHRHRRGR